MQGGAHLVVNGRINDNSEGGGWPADPQYYDDQNRDEYIDPAQGLTGYALAAGSEDPNPPDPNYSWPVYATQTRVVGGVDDPYNYRYIDYTEDRISLVTESHPFPDPLMYLETPYVGMGVPSYANMTFPYASGDWQGTNQRWHRGTVSLNGTPGGSVDEFGTVTFSDPKIDDQGQLLSDPERLNRVIYDSPDFPDKFAVFLHPGVYQSIDIGGAARVRFLPGIYVLKPAANTVNVLKVTNFNGDYLVIADGVMFYNTGNNYTPPTGLPDSNDASKGQSPPGEPDTNYADMTINAAVSLSPIDTENTDYQPYYAWAQSANGELPADDQIANAIGLFDGMLFYQRRWSWGGLAISGDAASGNLAGTLYLKWGYVQITGSGTYDAQFVVGSMKIAGNGLVTILNTGPGRGKAPRVYLVEGKYDPSHDPPVAE